MKSVAVVTATIGRPTLEQAIESVEAQTYPCNHYVVVDGNDDVEFTAAYKGEVVYLPRKTGSGKMMNGCILAMAAYLCTEDYLCFLDDDNWMEPNHVESLVAAMEKAKAAYAYCLRNLVNPDGSFFARDDGESTGHLGAGFVDANCYLFRRDLATGIAPLWVQTNETMNISDRHVWATFQQHKTPWAATGLYTLNYRISARGQDMKPFFFLHNILARSKHPDGFPWAASAS